MLLMLHLEFVFARCQLVANFLLERLYGLCFSELYVRVLTSIILKKSIFVYSCVGYFLLKEMLPVAYQKNKAFLFPVTQL